MKRHYKRIVVLMLAIMAALFLSACPPQVQAGEANDRGLGFEAAYLLPTQVEGDRGEFSEYRSKATARWGAARLTYERRWFDWKSGELHKLPFGDGRHAPWKNLHHLEMTGLWDLPFGQKWNLRVEAGASASFEKQFGGPGGILGLTAGYALSPSVSLRFGVRSHVHEHRVFLVPDLGLDFNQGVERGLSASIGLPETRLDYRFSQAMAVRLFAALDRGYYNLSEQSSVSEDGYLNHYGYLSGLMLCWTPSQYVEVQAGPVYSFGTTWTLYDRDGDELKEYDVDGGLGGVLMMRFSF